MEANPVYWEQLAHRKCQTVGAVIGHQDNEKLDFKFDNNENGGIVGTEFDNKQGGVEKRSVSLSSLFRKGAWY